MLNLTYYDSADHFKRRSRNDAGISDIGTTLASDLQCVPVFLFVQSEASKAILLALMADPCALFFFLIEPVSFSSWILMYGLITD